MRAASGLHLAVVFLAAAVAAAAATEGYIFQFSDLDSLLQTYQQVDALALAASQSRGRSNATVSMPGMSRKQSEQEERSCLQPYPLQLQLGLESNRALGLAPGRAAACGRGGRASLLQFSKFSFFPAPLPEHWGYVGFGPLFVLIAYFLASALALAVAFRGLWRPAQGAKPPSQDPEVAAWRQSRLRWLIMDWASQWVVQWGRASGLGPTKIRADEVRVLTDPDDGCGVCFRRFERLWKQEIEREGLSRASLLKVVIRLITFRKVAAMVAWNTVYESCLFLGPPLAIEWITNYANHLYTQRMHGKVVPQSELVWPSIFAIAIFTGLPIVVAVSNTVANMINARIGVRVAGALASAVFVKGQHLPVGPPETEVPALATPPSSNDLDSSFESHSEGDGPPSISGSGSDKNSEDALESASASSCSSRSSTSLMPDRFSLVQLVTSEIVTNIMVIPLALARLMVMMPVMGVMFFLLCRKVGWAFVFCIGVTIPMVLFVIALGSLQKHYLLSFMNSAGKRLQFFQQVMFSVRLLKSFGAEGLCKARLEDLRSTELQALNKYYYMMCFIFQAQWQFPRLYLFASLGGYVLLYGDIPVTTIIAIVPLLSSFQSCVSSVIGLIPSLVSAKPSCLRLEAFLKLPEAPRFSSLDAPRTAESSDTDGTGVSWGSASATRVPETMPEWISTWPAAKTAEEAGVLRVQGSFSWQRRGRVALRDLDLMVPRGQLVAVLGPPGAGKTALAHAVLGELYPQGEARIQVPGKIAYSAQVPHLIEGSLKENILYMESLIERRYAEAVHAADLLPDIEALPGSEEVPIGSRGISLSGSQRTRVSLARAAYCPGAEVVVLDDAFGSVDGQTARHLMEHMICGPLMEDRTRIVVCQPDNPDRLACFDRIIVLCNGRVAAQGAPQDVLQTNAYKKLLGSTPLAGGLRALSPGAVTKRKQRRSTDPLSMPWGFSEGGMTGLRDEESQGRASWETVWYFLRQGGRVRISICIFFFLLKSIFDMAMNMVLASWTTDGSLAVRTRPQTYLAAFCFWWVLSCAAWFICWSGGHAFTLSLSKACHDAIVRSLMRAPVDSFYDKTPVGRIMNRVSNDVMSVDLQIFLRVCAMLGMIWSVVVPLIYVHIVMPWWFLVISLPCYYLFFSVVRLYWGTMVPLRYLTEVCKSVVNAELTEVENSNTSIRAYRKADTRLRNFQAAMADLIGARFASGPALKCWLGGRLLMLGGLFATCLGLAVIWVPNALDVGRSSLCMMVVFSILSSMESSIEVGASAQCQLIAMNRIHEYITLPEERPEELISDKTYSDFMVTVLRSSIVNVKARGMEFGSDDALEAVDIAKGHVLLREAPEKRALIAAAGHTLAELVPSCAEFRLLDGWHRLVGVNGSGGSTEDLLEELCEGDSPEVTFHIKSGWLAEGAALKIEHLRAGYAGLVGDVLQGVNLSIPRKCKAGIVGPAGSGKSTLLHCILRLMEPRQGRIRLEGRNTQSIGLRTIKSKVGLVTQHPLILEGSLRTNLDPFGEFSDACIWEALRLLQLEDFVFACPGGLDFVVLEEGINLSFGHQQLLCLARICLRKPDVLLLDAATSSLDPHTEETVMDAILKAFAASTVLVVSDSIELVLNLDLVAVIKQGVVIEKGAPEELSKSKDGAFAQLLAAERGEYK